MITSTIQLPKKPTRHVTFPVLAKHNISQLVVLFCDATTGTVLVASDVYTVGHYSNEWVSVLTPASWEILPVGATITLTVGE